MTTHIYTLSDPETNDPRYVGKTILEPSRRLQQHLRQKENPRENKRKRNWILQLAAKDLVPVQEVIEIVEGDRWAEREIYWIALHRFEGCDLLNMTDGGEGVPGRVASQETCEKMRLAMTGKTHSDETKKKISDARKGRPGGHLGCRHSVETQED